MTRSSRGIGLAVGILVLGFASAAAAQENLDQGKNGAQLYASDCAICHKSPQKLGSGGGIFGLESFLREHYTASRQSAAVIAAYLRGIERTAPAAPAHGRAIRHTAKDDERGKPGESKLWEKKPEAGRAGEGKPARAQGAEPKSAEARPAEKPSEAKPSEAKASAPKPTEPKASDPKASGGSKPQ